MQHLVLGMVDEPGEIADQFKKWMRGDGSDETLSDRASYLNLSPADLAEADLGEAGQPSGPWRT